MYPVSFEPRSQDADQGGSENFEAFPVQSFCTDLPVLRLEVAVFEVHGKPIESAVVGVLLYVSEDSAPQRGLPDIRGFPERQNRSESARAK